MWGINYKPRAEKGKGKSGAKASLATEFQARPFPTSRKLNQGHRLAKALETGGVSSEAPLLKNVTPCFQILSS